MVQNSIVIFIIVVGCAFLLARRQKDRAFTTLMTAYGVVLAFGTAVTLNGSIGVGAWNTPYLGGSDGEGYFEQARLLADQGIFNFESLIRSNYVGYQIFLALLFTLFAPTLLVGLVANQVILLLSVICLYRATLTLTASKRAALLACAAMMLTSAHIYYALVLLKEPILGLAFALVLLAVIKTIQERRAAVAAAGYMLCGLILILTMRATVLLFLFILLIFVGRVLIKKRLHLVGVFILLIAVAAPWAQQFTLYEIDSEFLVQNIVENQVITSRFEEGDLSLSGVAGMAATFYFSLPFFAKVLIFPLPVALQVLLPFDFWSAAFLDDHPSAFFARNLNLLWLLIVAPWVLFALVNSRRIAAPFVTRFLLAGTCYYIGVAIVYGGLIPRYGTPALFFIYPAVGYWWDRTQQDIVERARAGRFFMHYYAMFILAGLGYMGLQLL